MKKQLLEQIKKINIYDYFAVLGLNYNVRQLRTYLSDLQKKDNETYIYGWEQAAQYLYGTLENQSISKKTYDRWCKRGDCEDKKMFLSGWYDHLLD